MESRVLRAAFKILSAHKLAAISKETVQNPGSATHLGLVAMNAGDGMKCRVYVDLSEAAGTVRLQEVCTGGTVATEYSAEVVGLSLA
jgi:hypothetical protein